MNFLAHLHLSGHDTEVIIGNFIGDFVKGRNLVEQFGPAIARGVELHREIDLFTDHHPVVAQSKHRLRPKYRHFSPVIIDVFYDHFLARDWSQYHPDPLPVYANRVYDLLTSRKAFLPEKVNWMVPYMIRDNWLVNYSQTEGIHRALSGMARRTPYDSKMDEAVADLKEYYHEFGSEFSIFFPQLQTFCKEWLERTMP